jgi:hypothetical protein
MDRDARELRLALERLTARYHDLAKLASHFIDWGEAWLALSDHTHLLDPKTGRGRKVAAQTFLIDACDVELVPEPKRRRMTPERLALRCERLDAWAQVMLDSEPVGEGDLFYEFGDLARARDLTHQTIGAVMRTE